MKGIQKSFVLFLQLFFKSEIISRQNVQKTLRVTTKKIKMIRTIYTTGNSVLTNGRKGKKNLKYGKQKAER